MNKKKQKITLNTLAKKMDAGFGLMNRKFKQVDKRFEQVFTVMHEYAMGVDERFDKVEGRLGNVEGRLGSVAGELIHVKNQMVTKDYLDNKLADLRGDMGARMRKGNDKFNSLVETLALHKAIPAAEADKILKTQPFARV